MQGISQDDESAIARLKARVVDKQNQLNGLNEYDGVKNNQLNNFANTVCHNESGRMRQADENVPEEATAVAKNAKQGDVFISHQHPERKILWLFPRIYSGI